MKEERKKKKKGLMIVVIVLAVLLAGTAAFCLLTLRHYYNKTNFETEPETTLPVSEIEASMEEIETLPSEDEEALQASIEAALREATETEEETEEEPEKDIYNLLLIGVDRRDASWNGNSDVMILCTVNYTEKTLTLTSFMRDLGVSIEGAGVRKLNHAFAIGGGPKLVSTLQSNFNVTIDNYAWVDFEGMKAVIDVLGGVDITMTPAEAKFCEISIDSTQVVHLNGTQALKHARNRFVGGTSDYGRTQRQRDILKAIIAKAKSGSISNLAAVANEVLPYINHNIEQEKLLSLIMDLPEIKDFEVIEQRVPFDGMYHSQGEYLIPDFKETINKLNETLN